uniref:hypothetical protein n=1 Tax=Flavobacterium sp. TaxID=239 RepID=UPI003751D8C6
NSVIGNNATGVYQDSNHPYATIDYVLALPAFKSGDIIWLQNENGNFPWNSNFTGNRNFTIKSDVSVTLNFSSHAPGYIASGLSGAVSIIKIDLPVGTIYNERSGGTGIALRDPDENGRIMLNINANYIYWNCSTTAGVLTGLSANKVSTIGNLFNFSTNVGHIFVSEIECLSNYTSFANGFKEITIGKITGSGSFAFSGSDAIWNIGDILTTGTSYISFGTGSRNTVNWMDSIISSSGGIELGSYYVGNTVHTGTIRSCARIYFLFAENANNNVYFKNFTADLGTGTIRAYVNNISFENCSIKALNSPITFGDYGLGSLTIKNSSFEVVNAVPLVTGGAGIGKTIKIAGLSTNATMISDQNGTGVTVTQFTNY